jgi:hypothetical protein
MAYHIYGDSNIAQFLSVVKGRNLDPQYQTITLTKMTNLVTLRDALSKPEGEECHTAIVVSAVTNLLTSKYFDDYAKMMEHCKETFHNLLSWVQEGHNHLDSFATQV